MDRVSIFVDGANFYHRVTHDLNFDGNNIDWDKLGSELCGPDRRLIRIHYYTAPVSQQINPIAYKGQQRFFTWARQQAYFSLNIGRLVSREKEMRCTGCKQLFRHAYQTEKGVDVHLATHLLTNAFDNAYDVAILISGDGDFAPAVSEVQRLRKRVENCNVSTYKDSHIAKVCDRFIELTPAIIQSCVLHNP